MADKSGERCLATNDGAQFPLSAASRRHAGKQVSGWLLLLINEPTARLWAELDGLGVGFGEEVASAVGGVQQCAVAGQPRLAGGDG